MNYIKYILTGVLPFVIFFKAQSQHLTKEFPGDKEALQLVFEKQYPLKENLFFISEIRKASWNDLGQLALAMEQSPGVVLFDGTGTQIGQPGNMGKGPGEYVQPSRIMFIKDTLYVWDSGQIKFLKFDTVNNKPLLEIKDFRWAVQDFTVSGNDIFFYNSGRTSGPYIEQYNISDNKYIHRFGKRTQPHTLLTTYRYAGGIGHRGRYVYYISPASLKLHRIDTHNFEESTYALEDSEFKALKVENTRQIIMDGEMQEVTNETGKVTDLFVLNDYLVISAQIGKDVYSEQFDAYLATERKVRFYVLNHDMEHLDTFTFSVAAKPDIQDKIWGANSTQLFFLSTYNLFGEESPQNENSPLYYMHIWDIEEIQE